MTMTRVGLLLAASIMAACSDSDNNQPQPGQEINVPERYEFVSQFDSEQSVSYSGQVMRHVLIHELNYYIATQLSLEIENGLWEGKTKDDVIRALEFYYLFDDTAADTPLSLSTNPGLKQQTFAQISSGKNLKGKLAGNDAVGQHKDWSLEFAGIGQKGSSTPESYLYALFDELAQNVVDTAGGIVRQNAAGVAITKIYETQDGRDLKQLIQKFLLGALAFSQAADDYLDDDVEGKGLNSDNSVADGEKNYTALEHQWDEGFGYFGATRDYGNYTDLDIVGGEGARADYPGYHDSDQNGDIDLNSEFIFGNAVNAAKRDLGADAESAPTDYTKSIFDAFKKGRAIITQANGELSAAQKQALLDERDIILGDWEKVIAATVVHYINDVLQDLTSLSEGGTNYSDLAKHWSEMKAFALNFQFNPHSVLSDEEFSEFHALVGDSPVLPATASAEVLAAYREALIAARTLLGTAYSFDPSNLGDADGLNGW